jgi:hypothetical protein
MEQSPAFSECSESKEKMCFLYKSPKTIIIIKCIQQHQKLPSHHQVSIDEVLPMHNNIYGL